MLDKGAMNGDSKNFHYIPSLTSMTESFWLKLQTLGTDHCFLGSDLPAQTNKVYNSSTAKIMVVFQNFKKTLTGFLMYCLRFAVYPLWFTKLNKKANNHLKNETLQLPFSNLPIITIFLETRSL